MPYKEKFVSGEWAAICDVCGWKYKASELKERWDGLRVCEPDWEPKPSQLIQPKFREQLTVPYVAPEPNETSVGPTYISTSLGVQENTIPSSTFE